MTNFLAGRHLPSGTVTFLFTDIEGSTKLAQQYPDQWEALRARHHSILQSAMDAHNGYVFQIIGDAFCVAFHTASNALNAAVDAQRKLQCEDWGESPIKVRMGLHTGSAELHGSDYRGYLTMAKVQRVMSVAYGGQALLSNTSADLVHGELPDGITLHDLKEHELKGLREPEHLWQVVAADLQRDFPPLQSSKEVPNNLPVQLTSFIGRKKEAEQIKKRLEKNRLVTLTGSGGVGKTRLSIQVASELLGDFPNGVWLVELAPVTEPSLVAQTVCATLGVAPQGNIPALSILTDYLKQRTTLLVIDNCEHLIDTCAQLCDSLLHACPHLRILASSREALGIDGENAYRVPSLSVPNPHDSFETIENSEAVKLFVERANTSLPDFKITTTNAPVVAQICQRLDGIALAIELAASRVKLLSVEQIAARLDDVFRLLTGGSRTALPRQQTLRALIDWSYNLLTEEERTVLRGLSVFVGGLTLEAAEAVCDNLNMLDLLTHLVDKSLVAVDLGHDHEPRYYLLETIRQYAREKLNDGGEGEFIRERHARWFVELAEQAEPELRGIDQFQWFDRIEQEYNNFRAALEWSLHNNIESGLRIGASLVWFWDAHDYCIEGVRYMERLFAATSGPPSILLASAFARSSYLAALAYDLTSSAKFLEQINDFAQSGLKLSRQLNYKEGEAFSQLVIALGLLFSGDLEQGLLLAERSLAIFQEAGIRWGMCRSHTTIAFFGQAQGDYEKAKESYMAALALSRQTGDLNMTTYLLLSLGRIAVQQEQYEQAQPLFQESLTMARQAKNKHVISGTLQALGDLYIHFKQYEQARDWLEECSAIQKDTGDQEIVFSLNRLGRVAYLLGEHEQAKMIYIEGLQLAHKYDSHQGLASYLIGVAELIALRNQPKDAAYLLSAASKPEFTTGLSPHERLEWDQITDSIRYQLDETSYAAAYEAGKQVSLDEAVAFALKELEQ